MDNELNEQKVNETVNTAMSEKVEPFTVASIIMDRLRERYPIDDLMMLDPQSDPLTGRRFRCTFTLESDAYTLVSAMEAIAFMSLTNAGRNNVANMILQQNLGAKSLPLNIIIRDDFGQYDSFNTSIKDYFLNILHRVENDIITSSDELDEAPIPEMMPEEPIEDTLSEANVGEPVDGPVSEAANPEED